MIHKIPGLFARFVNWSVKATGSSVGFSLAIITVLIWIISGPYFNWSENWQLVINTGTTIITFLMVFLIQNSQNRHSKATHLKLNELITSIDNAKSSIMNVERLSEHDMDIIAAKYKEVADASGKE